MAVYFSRHQLATSVWMRFLFRLLNELKTASKSSDEIKTLFWRDSELFISFVNVLLRFVTNKSKYLAERADQIE